MHYTAFLQKVRERSMKKTKYFLPLMMLIAVVALVACSKTNPKEEVSVSCK